MGRQSAHGGATVAVALLAAAMHAMAVPLRALEVELSDSTIERALRLARFPASDADRARFHRSYVVPVGGPAVNGARLESIAIITEFRRMELIAEAHARINDMFGRSSLTQPRAELAPWEGKVYVAANVSLSGNAIGVPPLQIALDSLPPLGPADVQNIYSENAVVGGVVATPFEARAVGQAVRIATVTTGGRMLGQARVDFRLID